MPQKSRKTNEVQAKPGRIRTTLQSGVRKKAKDRRKELDPDISPRRGKKTLNLKLESLIHYKTTGKIGPEPG